MMASGLAISVAAPAAAETLESALAKAYQGNPSLNASRAGVRAIDENVAIAQSGYRPQVNVGASIGVQYLQTRSASTTEAAAGAAATGATTATTGTALGGTSTGTTGIGTSAGTTGIGTSTGTSGLGTTTSGTSTSGTGGAGGVGGASSTATTAQTITSNRTVRTTYLPSTASLTVSQTIFNGFQTDNLTRRAESNVFSQRETLRFTELTVLYAAEIGRAHV